MKNLLIYSLHRSRGSAGLWTTRRAHRLLEPFNTRHLTAEVWSEAKIASTQMMMSRPNTAVKIHGDNVETTFWAKDWYRQVQANTEEWDLIVIERRDRTAQMLSFLIALEHGFDLGQQRADAMTSRIEVTAEHIAELRRVIEHHLRWYPSRGQVMTWRTRDAEWFNREQTLSQHDQQSSNRVHLITNLEWVRAVVEDIRSYYEQDWDQCIRRLAPQWDFDSEREPEYHR
jgi:hypothetical protein